jgi:hypothetical protein
VVEPKARFGEQVNAETPRKVPQVNRLPGIRLSFGQAVDVKRRSDQLMGNL